MKTKTNFRTGETHHSAGNRFPNHTQSQYRPTKFEIQLNRFFYRLFGALSLFIFLAAIYEGAYHQLFTAAITGIMARVIYEENRKNSR